MVLDSKVKAAKGNLGAVLAWLLGPIGFLYVFLFKRNDKFAWYHAKQAIVLFFVWVGIYTALMLASFRTLIAPFAGWAIDVIVGGALIALIPVIIAIFVGLIIGGIILLFIPVLGWIVDLIIGVLMILLLPVLVGIYIALFIILGIFLIVPLFGWGISTVLGTIIALGIPIICLIHLFLAYAAYRGEWFTIPIIGWLANHGKSKFKNK